MDMGFALSIAQTHRDNCNHQTDRSRPCESQRRAPLRGGVADRRIAGEPEEMSQREMRGVRASPVRALPMTAVADTPPVS